MSGTLKVNGYIGSAGNENFYGTSGAETFEGRGGDDIYRINNVGDRVIERKGDGHDTIVATLDFALAEGVEVETIRAAKSIGAADIKLTGNAFAQTLEGTEGRNVLDGRGGADIMRGKGGDDRYYVDSARDVVIEERGGGFDTILTSVSFALAAGLEIEALEIADPAKSSGSTVRLTGNEFANRLTGDRGDNVLDGGGGIDIMRGLGGNDTYTVDKARDQVIEAKGGGTDTVVTTVSYALTAGQEIEALQLAASTGQANLNLTGNEFANAIRGNDGNNVLDGSSGSDILTGRAGLDAFVFSTKLGAGNVDRITDFAPVDDTIRLSEDIFTALGAGPLRAAAFKDLSVAGAKVDASDRILYDRDTGALSYDADGSGTAKAIKFAVLDNHAKLTHDDFFVV